MTNDLPADWATPEIGEILQPLGDGRTIHQGWSPRCEKDPSVSDEEWGVLKTTAIQAGEFLPQHNKRLPNTLEPRQRLEVKSRDLLLTSAGPRSRCGVACLVKNTRPKLMISGKMYRFRFDADSVLPEYIEAYLQSHSAWTDIDEMKTGVSDSGLNLTQNRFRRLKIPLAPVAEQKRIITAIEEHFFRLDAVKTALDAARRRLDALRRSATARLFDRSDWTWTTLGEIAALKGGITKDSKREADPDYVEYPYLRVANVQRGFLDLTVVTTIRADRNKAEKLVLHHGDILFNEGGDRDKLGRGWVWEGQIENCIHQNHVFRARLANGDFDPYFVSMHANTWGQQWFETHGKQTTNLASINLTTLKSFPVPAPSLEDQQAVVAELQSIAGAEHRLQADLDRAQGRSRTLRRSILAKAFTGQLVPQDPTDESASVLLERIAASRSTKPNRRASARQVS